MGFRANIAAIVVLGASCAGSLEAPVPENDTTDVVLGGKADTFDVESTTTGRCAADSPATPYSPIPQGTRTQPGGPTNLATRIGAEIPVDPTSASRLVGEFENGDCGRHYFTFTLPQRSLIRIGGTSTAAGAASSLGVCFVRPSFLRIDASWYDDIWETTPYSDAEPAPPCETFVPVGETMQPSSGASMEFGPGVYELTIDPAMMNGAYELELDFIPLSDAVCGDGVIQPSEGCDDGGQEPLDFCGADCQPQRLDVEPIEGNETFQSAQPLDEFRVINFYAPRGSKNVDVYRLDLTAGDTVAIGRGERLCEGTFVQLFDDATRPVTYPWSCTDGEIEVSASQSGRYYLRIETAASGGRSIRTKIR